ncbi:hypothetical protein NC653_016966 [Populus alba x Populus x berolinensis]|uniref:Uncharacterized protein n=1 Tax=Populus alba x Populus x berolinensis TaxID=444605 RepID=A0AAD6VZX8_9ROSI|nr:hypothetical protein NC653_016966 [Populus alba x Populus x berolinensis]
MRFAREKVLMDQTSLYLKVRNN